MFILFLLIFLGDDDDANHPSNDVEPTLSIISSSSYRWHQSLLLTHFFIMLRFLLLLTAYWFVTISAWSPPPLTTKHPRNSEQQYLQTRQPHNNDYGTRLNMADDPQTSNNRRDFLAGIGIINNVTSSLV
jgi:hypothetical protein